VVKNYHFRSLNEEIGPQLFTMKPDNSFGLAFIKIKPKTETASLQHIEASFKKLFPLTPYTYKFKDLENIRAYEAEAKWKQMMLFGAVLTIFISCIGLFGLSVLAAEKRTKEIGIRKVLGASISGIATALSKDFLKLVAIAMLIAMPAAWYFTSQWLQNYPYRIELSWPMFALAGLLVLLIAIITVSFQAIKAAIANPVKSLRSE
jgi:putative ABC transport system permease protein